MNIPKAFQRPLSNALNPTHEDYRDAGRYDSQNHNNPSILTNLMGNSQEAAYMLGAMPSSEYCQPGMPCRANPRLITEFEAYVAGQEASTGNPDVPPPSPKNCVLCRPAAVFAYLVGAGYLGFTPSILKPDLAPFFHFGRADVHLHGPTLFHEDMTLLRFILKGAERAAYEEGYNARSGKI
jgi:hypothetical protein